MALITKIGLQNFKFFRQREEFDADGKHLLIYGENGSGKSSFYWSLYTLLECANKDADAKISRYFDLADEVCLTNRFLQNGQPDYVESEIKLDFDDGTDFCLSANDLSIRGNTDAQASNYASEFLNYRMLFRIHDFFHGSEINLFEYFKREVFPYVKIEPVNYWRKKLDGTLEETETEDTKFILDLVEKGTPKTSKNKNGDDRLPRKTEPDYQNYDNTVKGFVQGVKSLLTYINTEGNKILEENFEGDFKFKLELTETELYKITTQKFTPPEFSISLEVFDFHGVVSIRKPQSFLNEARLSALGLAMRFAILKRRLQTAKLKLALLDDFMISLDMNNRDVALNYVFDEVAVNYQTIILTNDRYFYEMAKDKIKRKGQEAIWKAYEMFEAFDDEDHPTTSKPKPCIINDKGKVNKARILFQSKDYASAANMIRQATEKLCKVYLTRQEMLDPNYGLVNLTERINRVIAKATIAGVDPVALNNLSLYKDRIMDLGSHHDIETPLFKNELRKAIETLEKLKVETNNPTL